MEDLIEALTIFSKYSDTKWPTICIHDVLIVVDVGEDEPSDEEQFRLEGLGFFGRTSTTLGHRFDSGAHEWK